MQNEGILCFAIASLFHAIPLRHVSRQCHSHAIISNSELCFGEANQSRPMPLHSVKNLIGEAALTRVTPLANATHRSIVQPFQNGLFVGIIHAQHLKLTG